MYCAHCGREMENHFRYCSGCGTEAGSGRGRASSDYGWNRLSRPREGKKIAGVCAGIARYFDIDVTLVRVVWILITILPPLPGIIAYIICWVVMPKDPLPQPRPMSTNAVGDVPRPQAT